MLKRWKKLYAVILAIGVFVCMFPFCSFVANADIGEDYNYVILDDNTVEISQFNGSDTDITIPETIDGRTVTSIGERAFYNNRSITSVLLPKGLTIIKPFAFLGCVSLTKITIPGNVKTVGAYSFQRCTKMKDVEIEEGVENLENGVFEECESLTEIRIPSSVTYMGKAGVFEHCGSVTRIHVDENNPAFDSREDCNAIIDSKTNVLLKGCVNTVIPKGITTIGDGAFRGATNMTEYTIPDGVTKIGRTAFALCFNLKDITIPDSVTEIGTEAFWLCTSLESLSLSGNLTTLADEAFRSCGSLHSIQVDKDNPVYDSRDNCNGVIETATNTLLVASNDMVIPESVTAIGDWAYSYHRNLTSFIVPNHITKIGAHIFYNCDNLVNVVFPDSIDRIEFGTFGFCGRLKSVVIPKSVTEIQNNVFPLTCSQFTVFYEGSQQDWDKIIIGGSNERLAEAKIVFMQDPRDIKDAIISGIEDKIYNGREQFQNLQLTYAGKELLENKDYKVSYKNNINAGTATMIISGLDNYTGTRTENFIINVKKGVIPTITFSPAFGIYDGKVKKPKVIVKVDGRKLDASEYSAVFTGGVMKNVGSFPCFVSLQGNYSGRGTSYFTISKASNKITKFTPTSKTISYKKTKKAKQSFTLKATAKFSGAVIFKMSPKTAAKARKYITVSSNGKVTVKKDTPKGKYTIKVIITTPGTSNYDSQSEIKTVKIVVR